MKKYKRLFSILLVSLFSMGVFSGCNNSKKVEESSSSNQSGISDNNKNDTPEVIRIGCFKGSAQIAVAKEDKLFEKYFGKDVKIEYNEFLVGPPMIEALIGGKLDFAITGDQPPVTAIANKQPIEIIGKASKTDKSMAFLVTKDSEIKSPKDLKGKTVGVARGTSLEYFAVKYLEKNGISKNDVTFVNLTTGEDTATALASKNIDAGVAGITTAKLLEEKGQGSILGTTEGLFSTITPILTTKKFREEHSETTKNFLKLFNEIEELGDSQKDRFIKLTAQASGISENVAESIYSKSNGVLLNDEDIDTLYNLFEFLKENKIVKNNINKEELYTEVLTKDDLK